MIWISLAYTGLLSYPITVSQSTVVGRRKYLIHKENRTAPIKKFLLSFVLGAFHFCIAAATQGGRLVKHLSTPLHSVARVIFPAFLWIYGIFVKIRITILSQKKDAGHIFVTPSAESTSRAVLIVFFGFIAIASSVFSSSQEDDELKPSSILARFVAPTEEIATLLPEDLNGTSNEIGDYTESNAVRPSKDLEEPSKEKTPQFFPGEIALNPDALLKPILPTGESLGSPPASNTIQTYIIKTGDTVSTIAGRFGLKVSTLLWANNLHEYSIIREGQNLTIPPVDGLVYTVRKGDTIARIAKLFDTDAEKILQINHLASADKIGIGQTLILPDAVQPAPVYAPRTQGTLLSRLRDLITPSKKQAPTKTGTAATRFSWPTSARRITQYFGWRHSGVDIAGPTSNSIYAAAGGRVALSGWQRGYGLTLLIDHGNGFTTRYGHSRKLFVSSGEYVEKGETIAMVGSTGRSTGPHLHFEILKNGRRVNPLSYIR